jgi:D-galactose 1-dehydrogenase
MPLSIAIVGLGKIAEDQHVPCIAANAGFALTGIVSQRGRALPGIPTYKTQAELFAAQPRLDAVALCMPPGPRYAYALEAIAAGKHVLLEKPTAATLGEAQALAAAVQPGRTLFATWHSRFNVAVAEAKRRLAGQRIRRLQIDWHESVRKWHPGQDWVFEPGGFGVFDPGINAFSILTEIMPGPIHVTSADLHFPANRQTPIAANLIFGSPSAESSTAPLRASLDWLKEDGETWTIEIESVTGERLTLTEGGAKLAVNGAPTVAAAPREYQAIYARFAELIAAGQSEMDLAPLTLVSDAFLVGKRVTTEAFGWPV